jgi:hypothetical protein
MKSILILIAGCVPLAALTAGAFQELAATSRRMPALAADEQGKSIAALAERSRAESRADRPVATALLEGELFAPQPIAALEAIDRDSPLTNFSGAWSLWLRIQAMIAAAREAEQLAAGDRAADLRRAADRFEQLADKYRAPLGGGDRQLRDHFRQRATELTHQIEQRTARARADALVEQARRAFRDERNSGCVALCDQLLSGQPPALDAETLEKVRLLRRRAQFRDEAAQLTRAVASAEKPQQRLEPLRTFVERWGRDTSPATPSERSILDTFQGDLRDAETAIDAAHESRDGLRLVDQFRKNPPPSASQRLQTAAKILARHPADAVRKDLQSDIRQWLAEALPEKRLDEPEMLQELETRDGQIVRGYFRPVNGGYKRYPTMEQRSNPISEVGTFLKEALRSEPGPSLPRRCLKRYLEARKSLVDGPGRAEWWSEFAGLCDELDASLRAYRAKAGSSAEPLSFVAEAQTARQFATLFTQPEIRRLVEP